MKSTALILVILAVLAATFTSQAQAHTWRIPNYVMAAAKGAASQQSTYTRCGWTNWYHNHIRCTMRISGTSAVMMFHRVGYHRYLMVGTMYGIVIMRKYMTL